MKRSVLARIVAPAALAAAAAVAFWSPGSPSRPAGSARDLAWLDRAIETRVPAAVSPTQPVATPDRAKLPRATGVSNGSYDTKIEGDTFVFGSPASAETKLNLRFGPVVVTSGGVVLSGGNTGDYDVANGGFEAKRGEIAERYMYDNSRVEQFFVIPTKPEAAGAIEVASPVAMTPGANVEVVGYGWHDARFAKGGLRVLDGAGSEVAAIYGARVVDADGRQLDLALGYENGAMTMTVPASFVAIATFPITVDPWIELAGSGTVGLPDSGDAPRLAYSGSGVPIVAFSDAIGGGDIRVRAFNSGTGTWAALGGGSSAVFVSAGASFEPDVACGDSLNPVVAWREFDAGADEIYAARWNGVAWAAMGTSLSVGGLSATPGATSVEPSVALDGSGNPVVAWTQFVAGVGEIYVRRFDGTAWVEVNPGSATGSGISGTPADASITPSLAIDPLGRIVVAWTEGPAPGKIFLRRFNPATTTWDEIASSGSGTGLSASAFPCGSPDVAFDAAGEPMVAYHVDEGAGNVEIYLKRFDSFSGTWAGIGGSDAAGGLSATAAFSAEASLGVDESGTPTVAWREQISVVPDVVEIFARRFNGTTWAQLEGSATAPSGLSAGGVHATGPSLAMRPDGYPGVTWAPLTLSPVLFRQYDGIPVPTAGVSQTQVTSPFAAILAGGTSATGSVRLTATIPAGIPTTARLQVEVRSTTGPAFTGIPTAESTLLAAGTTAAIVVPLAAGTYEWQYRVQAADPTINSFFTEFVVGGATDFVIGTTPTAPAAGDLTQRELVSDALLADGGSTLNGGIKFRYTPPAGLPEALRLQVDFTGDGVVDVESPLNPAASTAAIDISVPLPLATYSWTARLQNAAGVSSALTAFETGGVPGDFTVAAAPAPTTSAVLSLPTQTRTDASAIAAGIGVTDEPMVVLGATITGTPGELVRLQFDLEPTASLDLVPDFETPLIAIPGAGFIAVTYTIPVGEGAYEWAVRAQNSLLVNTAYTAGTGSSPDFNVDTPFIGPPPASPTVLGQFYLDGTTAILTGGSTLEGAVTFRATLPASTDMVRLQVDVVPEASAFGFPVAESPLLPGGSVANITVPVGIGSFKWRVRTASSTLATSAFVEFTPVGGPDFVSPSTPTVPPGVPTLLAQRNLDATAIPSMGTAFSSTVMFEAVVPGLVSEVNRVQFDIELTGFGLDGVPDIESPLAAGGSTVNVSVPLGIGTYIWAARGIGPTGLTSAWTAFPGGPPDFSVVVGSSIPPTAPVTLSQRNVDGSVIASGGTAAGNTVVFEVVVPGAASELNRVQVDVEATASPLDGQPDAESPLVAGGTTVQIAVPFGVGSYNWATRTQSSLGLNSGWTSMPGGPADFIVATGGGVPSAPAALAQENPDGSAIGSGGTAAGSIVVFEVLVPGLATDLGRIQVDVETTLAGLDGIPDIESPLVSGGTTVSISVALADASYNWQARTQSGSGANSGFTAFAGGPPDFVVLTGSTPPAAPAAPVTMFQRNLDMSLIASGGTTAGSVVVFEVLVPGLGTDLNRIQVSYATPGAPDTTPELESPLVAGGSTVVLSVALPDASFNWQARTLSSFDLASAYTPFAGGPPDFIVSAGGAVPSAPVVLAQENLDGSAIVSTGTAATDTVVLEATVPGLATELNRVQFDVELTGFGLDGVPDIESPLVAGGSIVNVALPLGVGSYNWAARTMSSTGLVSAYTAFAGGPPDFNIVAASAPVAPTAPVTLFQRNLDGSVIPFAGGAAGATVVFEVVVPGVPADLNRIQIDVEGGGPLDGMADAESPLVAGGTTVQVSLPFGVGGYNWAARTQSSFGLNSGWTAGGAGTPDFFIDTGGAPPSAPAALAQENPDGSAIVSGGTAAGSFVVFEVLVPGAATDLNRIQVDVETTLAGLDGIPDVESPIVAGGTTVSISVALADGSYDWQAATQSAGGANSGFTAFAGGPSDFVIFTGSVPPPAPAAPATMDQLNLDLSSIPSGGTAAGNVVVFEVLVPGLGSELNRIQVSYATGVLDATPEIESPLVSGGSTVTMSVPLAAGSYNWQARTMSSFDLTSAYTPFAGGPPDFVVATGGAVPAAPLAAAMDQQNPDASSIASGGTAAGSIVVFEVSVPGLATDFNRIQIDVEAGALDGIPDVESPLVAGGTTVTVGVPLANGLYNWQARTQSVSGAVSAFTPFTGGPSDFQVDTTTPVPPAPGAPVALSMDQQNLDGTSILASGGTALDSVVVFEVVVPGVPADLNRIQVDVETTGALDGVVNFESPLVPGGTTVQIQASFANGSYEWQARTQSSMSANSAFTAFTGGPDDFVVAQGGPVPPVSSGLTQTNSDGSAIASGATTATGTVVFGGTVSTTPAGGSARLQVEFSTGGFTGVPDVESPLVPDGTTVSISVPMADGSYEWQARTMSSGGAASAFTAFAGGAPDFVVAVGGGGVPPSAPSGLDQQNLDGSSIPLAGAATGSTVVFEAVVGGAPGSLNRLQVEFNPTGPGFSGVPDVESPLVTAGSVVHIAVPHTPGTFQWQARTQSSTGAVSAFVEFAALGGTDYVVTSIAGGPAPAFPIALTQLELDGVTGIPPGGTTTEPVVVFRATLPGAIVDLNRLQVEYLPAVAILFTGNPSVESPLVPGGSTVSIVVPMSDGSWQWRARSQSSSTAVSTWVDFGGAAPGTDFIVSTAGVLPPPPAGLAQQNADGSAIPPAGTAVTDVVRFGATVTSTTGEDVSLQVDFAPVGGLSGTPDVESPLVPTGSLVFITIPLGDGSYEWQARTRAASGGVSTYTPFGGTSGVTPDFIVAAGAGGIAPAVPSGLTQRRLDQTIIADTGTTSGDTVVFEGTVSGPPGSFLRLEVEYTIFGTGLAGVPDVESPLVPTGSTVQVSVALGDGSYEWQARARTSSGAVSAFALAFGPADIDADFVVAAGSGGVPPAVPAGIGQFRIDGFSAIPVAGVVTDDKLIFRGTVSGLVTNLFRFQVEYVDSAGAFTGNPTVESPLVPGSSLVSIAVPIGDGNYMWRARSQSSTGAASGWVNFAGAAGTDFTVASSGLTPPPPVGLAQETLSTAPIPAGGTTFSDTVVFRGTVTSASPGGLVKMQVEFAPVPSLGGVPDVESPLVPSGTSVTIAVPLGDGTYEWQARTVNPGGLASAFVPFGGSSGVTDFIVSAGTGGPAPTIPAGLAQRRLDQSLIPAGGTTSGDTVVFEALVTGAAGSLLRLQVEYAISGGGLTGIPDVESVLVPTGSTVQIAVPLGDGSYEWQARTQSSLGAVSAFVEFNPVPAAIDFVVAAGVGTIPPGPPTSLEQRTLAGALIPSGGTVSDDAIVFRGTVPAGPLFVRMQVEFVVLPTVFSGVPSVESPLVAGGSVVSITVPMADGIYGWQARAQTSTGGSSGYASFGLVADTDFIIAANGVPPPAPTGLVQLDSVGVVIPAGGTTFASTVQFQAVATGDLPGDSVRLQVDFASPGSLSGAADVESPFAPSGSTITVAVPLGNGPYEWQCRTFGPAGAVSPWAEFVAGLATDFIVDAGSGVVPPAPTALDQLMVDGTPIAPGATVYENTVKFTGVVTTLDASLARLQIDFSPLSGVIDVESPFVPSGSAVEITVPLPDGPYEWQARTAASTSAVSPFAAFAGGPPDFIIDADESTNPPATPTVIGQQDPLGVAIPVGGDCYFDSIVLFATLPGLPTDLIRLQLEIKPVADVFTGTPDVQSILLSGGSTAFVTVPLGDGAYHWQARAQRSAGVSSAWVEFGANPTASTDFVMDADFPGFAPLDPSSLGQFTQDLEPIPVGNDVPDGDIRFRAFLDGDPAKQFRLQIEVRATTDPFTGLVTHESMLYPAGSTAEIAVYLGSGSHHWRARTITSSDVVSNWVSFGANADGEQDFEIRSPQNGAEHHISRKTVRRCGLTGFEFPALFGLYLLGRKAVRRVRRNRSSK